MEVILFTANCKGKEDNCLYPNRVIATDAAGVAKAVAHDQVFAQYKGNYRSKDNFLESGVIPVDCDNDHSDDPADWLTPESLSEMFQDVDHIIIPSRNNMRPKGGKSARPRMHVLFPTKTYTDHVVYAEVKAAIQRKYPFFDDNALDAARFFFGSDVDAGDIIWNEGFLSIDETLDETDYSEEEDEVLSTGGTIPEGMRNNTMSRFAGCVLKRYGATEKAHDIFLAQAAKCDPPLSNAELGRIWQSAMRFGKKVSRQPGYIPPDEYNNDFGDSPGHLRPDDYSDIGQAKVLAREYGSELRYTAATDYLRFNGNYWVESKQQATGAMEAFLDLQLQDAADCVREASEAMLRQGLDPKVIKAGGKRAVAGLSEKQAKCYRMYLAVLEYHTFVMKRRDMKYVLSALQAAKPMLEVSHTELNRDPFLLNTPAGTCDLRLGLAGLRPHDPADLITRITAAALGDQGMALWQEFLDRIFCGDQDLIGYVQQIAGLAAIGKVYQETLIISYGEGSNGKSTFWNSIAAVLGSYSGTISADALTTGCRRNVKPELAEALGKRLLIAAELEEGMRLSTSIIKQLCSTDDISAEKKYKDPFSYKPSHMLVLYTNHLPKIGAMDSGTWRRLIVVPFNAKITGAGDIKNYSDYLVKNAGPSILAWVIEGAQKAIQNDFKLGVPACVQSAIDAYRADNDWLGHFLEDCCEVDPAYSEKSGDFYNAYRSYCAQTGEYIRDSAAFYAAIEQSGFQRFRKTNGRFVGGLRLRQDDFLD